MDLHQQVSSTVKLATLPEVYLRARELMQDPRASSRELAEVVSHDPALAMRLLKLVNSAFYGLPSKITNIAQAVTIVGQRELHNLILAMSAAHAFARIPGELVNMGAFWHHSVYCAVVARLLASHCGLRYPSQMFTAGLLHDIGQPIMTWLSDERGPVARAVRSSRGGRYEIARGAAC